MPTRSRATIHEVARLAKVGIGTVSRVLNNHPSVRRETRQRVELAMERLGYSPNPHARRVAGGRSYTVSVMLPFVGTEFYTRLIEGIETVLLEARYDIALFPLLSQARLERFLSSHTLAYQTDGLLVASYNLSELFPTGLLPTDRPVVFVDAQSPRYDSVYTDNRLGGQLAALHLAKFPGSFFAIKVEEELDQALSHTVFAERLAGFTAALKGAGYRLPTRHIFRTRLSAEGGRLALQHFMSLAPGPYTIFAGADLLAMGVLEEAQQRGLTVGRDVRVLGYDGQPWTEAHNLSTLTQPVEAMGARAARALLERLGGYGGPPRMLRLEPSLVARHSTLGRSAL
jgi:LacI family transcriptional regulator